MVEGEIDRADVSISGFAPKASTTAMRQAPASVLPSADADVHLSPRAVVHQGGIPGADDRVGARQIKATMPARLRAAAWRAE